MEQTPHGTPEEPEGGMCGLSVIIIVTGIVMTAITIGNAKGLATDNSGYFSSVNYSMMKGIVIMGILNCLWSVALAVIVDDCDRYRKNH